jgi:hypothetical protein
MFRPLPTIAASLVVAGIIAPSAQAGLIAYDGFQDYSAGSQFESGADGAAGPGLNGGSGWASAWDSLNSVKSKATVVAPATPLSYSAGSITINGGNRAAQLVDTGTGAVQPLGRAFAQQTGTVYVSLLFRPANGGTLESSDLMQFLLDSALGNHRPSVSFGDVVTNGAQLGARVSTGSADTSGTTGSSFTNNTTYFLVAEFSKSGLGANADDYDTARLFVNPTSTSLPVTASASATAESGLTSLSVFDTRTNALDADDFYQFDELRIGDTYASVVPEPASLGVLAVGGLMLLRRRKA